jgi:hypothetical protein
MGSGCARRVPPNQKARESTRSGGERRPFQLYLGSLRQMRLRLAPTRPEEPEPSHRGLRLERLSAPAGHRHRRRES